MARFLLSKKKAVQQHNAVKNVCDEVSYSLKTNFEVGKVLENETDCSFSVHSTASLDCLSDKNRAWFFTQGASEKVLDSIRGKVKGIVVDNEQDLHTVVEFLDRHKLKTNLLLRMRLKENTVRTGKHFVYGMFSNQINKLIPGLRKNKRINKLGIHFHRKTQNISEWSLKYELAEALTDETLNSIDCVNIGGGIPYVYKNYRENVIDNVFERIKEVGKWLKEKNIRMIIEPGRFIAAPAVKLESEILSVSGSNAILDCSIYNSAMDTFTADIRLLVEGELESGQAYVLKGCTPDSMDIFRYRAFLEPKKAGDKIVFLNAGAYNYRTDFCKLPLLKTVIVD